MPRRSIAGSKSAAVSVRGMPVVANSAVPRGFGLVLEQHDEHVAVPHELDRAAAEVAALLGEREVGEVHDRLAARAVNIVVAPAHVNASGAPSRRTVMRPSHPAGSVHRTSCPRRLAIYCSRAPVRRVGRWRTGSGHRDGSPRPSGSRRRALHASRSSSLRRSARCGPCVRLGAGGFERAVVAGLGHQPHDLVPVRRGALADDPAAARRRRTRSTGSRGPRTRPRRPTTSRRSRPGGAIVAIADSLSASGPIVTMTEAAPPGSSRSGLANVSQKWWQVMQPLERNASSVGCGRSDDPITTASPPGVCPPMSVAVGAARGGRGASRVGACTGVVARRARRAGRARRRGRGACAGSRRGSAATRPPGARGARARLLRSRPGPTSPSNTTNSSPHFGPRVVCGSFGRGVRCDGSQVRGHAGNSQRERSRVEHGRSGAGGCGYLLLGHVAHDRGVGQPGGQDPVTAA